MMGEKPEKALAHYEMALAKGYDAFWIKYNRGSLLLKMGLLQRAKDDFKQCLLIKPDDHRADHARIHDCLRQIDMMLREIQPQ